MFDQDFDKDGLLASKGKILSNLVDTWKNFLNFKGLFSNLI